MTDQETISTKETLEGVKAINEMIELFGDARKKISPILAKFIEGVDELEGGKPGFAWFRGMAMVAELDVDDAQGGLIVALTTLAQINAKLQGTPAQETLREILYHKENG